ncbi:MAG: bifunctional riboflavin kinase/FAD synthetase [Verrucomicrobia bacterium]|nr:bifunctional riboflavin kinase/FAD synthetase [Verrucomicrobiota bacterium]
MSLFRSISALSVLEGPAYLAIGVFDGVHRGHRAVIGRALEDARREPGGHAVVVTFEPHPMRVLRPEAAPRLLTSPAHLLKVLARVGVPNVLVLPFDRDFAARTPEEFIGELVRACRPLRQICVGYDWSFGRGRSGNVDSLTRLGREFGFTCVGLPPVLDRTGQQISSTLIRAAVAEGDLARAAELLGREFTILGTVVPGRKLARTLGFPTANLAAHNEQFPPNGVYAAAAWVDGRERPGILNLGVRPTVDGSGERVLELHIFDFEGDLYGRDIEVAFRRFLRPEQKFAGLDALKAQIAADCAEARAFAGLKA